MNRRFNRCVRRFSISGFTLIEVLVVVAIIALLISILMPSLSQAREQAKTVRCLANLNQLGKGSNAYLGDNKDRFAWGPVYNRQGQPLNDASGAPLTRTWYYGGNRGQDSAELGTGGYYQKNSTHDWSPAERPMNRYVYQGGKLSKTDQRPLRKEGELRLYECPSDRGVRWNGNPNSELHETTTSYLETGTSFMSNNSWIYFAKSAAGENAGADRIRYLMNRIIKIFEKKGASRAVLLYEDTADWAFNTADLIYDLKGPNYKVRSWHNKYDIHNLLFLDGHASALYVDWRLARYSLSNKAETAHKGMTATWVIRQNWKED